MSTWTGNLNSISSFFNDNMSSHSFKYNNFFIAYCRIMVFYPKTNKIYDPCIKVSIFHTFCLIKKILTRLPNKFIYPLERVCLILQNTLNLEKWQYFYVQNFSLKFHDFPFKSMCFYIIDELTCSYKIICMVRYIFFIFKWSVDLLAWHMKI